ncbi:MAG: thiamine pyrophosphate-dependent enzyme [Actinomycetota bacterium]
MSKTVAEVILEVLADAGVKHMFGIPGDAINGLTDALRRQDRIRFIQVRHEEVGALAASAQGKLTGELAVCVGTAGPGAIHLLNGLYDAKLDGAPVLALTGQVPTSLLGSRYHQEIDLFTLFKDATVFNQSIVNADQMPGLLVRACQLALATPGPVHLGIPSDMIDQKVRGTAPALVREFGQIHPCNDDLDDAAELLNRANAVAILAGRGARGAAEQLVSVAETLAAPIIKALGGKDILPDDHPMTVGGLGLLGTKAAVATIENCDALLMVGTDFPYADFYPEAVPSVQIDVVPTRIGQRFPVDVALHGHANLALSGLLDRIEPKTERGFLVERQADMAAWREALLQEGTSDATPIKPQRVARSVSDHAAPDAVFVCDTGTVTAWTARHVQIRQDQCFTLSGGLGTMGYGMAGAIGAQLAYPGRQVIAMVGDGGFTMLMPDLVTAVRYELPIDVVVFNNGRLGLIELEQTAAGFPVSETTLADIDIVGFARSCGAFGVKVETADELEPALKEAFSSAKPSVIEVVVDPDEIIIPPKITAKQAVNFVKAKTKELFA